MPSALQNTMFMSMKTEREILDLAFQEMSTERSKYETVYQSVGDFILPNRYRYAMRDTDSGSKRDHMKIVDPTATRSLRSVAAGMLSGGTSPARPWFKLATPDKGALKFGPIREYLHHVTQVILSGFLQSNLYQNLPLNYMDTAGFGTAAMLVEENFESLLHTWSFPCGSYWIAKDRFGRVNQFMYEFRPTIYQLVNTFGTYNKKSGSADWSNFSQHVKDLFDHGQYQTRIPVRFAITPNDKNDQAMFSPEHKKYRCFYYEVGGDTTNGASGYPTGWAQENKFLKQGGYSYFPILAPRWSVVGDDVYGTDSPGEITIGDVKQLQTMVRRKSQAVELKIRPPMVADPSLRTASIGIIPGHITYVGEDDGRPRFRSALDVNIDVSHITADIQDIRNSIRENTFENLFLSISSMERGQVTAREVEERHSEKLMMLGPVIHQLDQDQNDPLISMAYEFARKQGRLPEPPQELEDQVLQVDYISILHQAQKSLGLGGMDRFFGFVAPLASFDPNVLHKIDTMEAIEEYADMTGIAPTVLNSDAETKARVQAQQQAMQEERQAQQMESQAKVVKDLGQASVDDQSALGNMINQATAGQVMPSGV